MMMVFAHPCIMYNIKDGWQVLHMISTDLINMFYMHLSW